MPSNRIARRGAFGFLVVSALGLGAACSTQKYDDAMTPETPPQQVVTDSPSATATAPSATASAVAATPMATASAEPSVKPQGSASPGDAAVVITLERTVCYGTCPSYVVTATGDGNVQFEGRDFVKAKGKTKYRVDPKAIVALADELEHRGYRHLARKNGACPEATDMPSAKTSLTRNGSTTSYDHYYGDGCAPPELDSIESRIDDVLNTKPLVQCGGPHGCQR
jgi:hypothetical protein